MWHLWLQIAERSHEETSWIGSWEKETFLMWYLWLQLLTKWWLEEPSWISSLEKEAVQCEICSNIGSQMDKMKKHLETVHEGRYLGSPIFVTIIVQYFWLQFFTSITWRGTLNWFMRRINHSNVQLLNKLWHEYE